MWWKEQLMSKKLDWDGRGWRKITLWAVLLVRYN